jgi:hypothetical protein
MDATFKNNDTPSSSSKLQSKFLDKVSTPSGNKEKEKIPTSTLRKNFESQSSTDNPDLSKVLKKPPPIETKIAHNSSPMRTSSPCHPVNNKQETTAPHKNSPVTTPIPFRPVNNKQETTTAAHKNSPVTTPIPSRPVIDKQEKTATIPKKPSSTTPTAIRPVNNKQETTAASKNSPATTSIPFRPVNNKQELPQKSVKGLVGKFNHN